MGAFDPTNESDYPPMTLFYWRLAGINYLKFSEIAARAVRSCLKASTRSEVRHAIGSKVKITPWKDGKAIKADSVK
ncbi:unnamed protein product [Soboliphyme baturini]|uniref:ATP synthase subunit epsilon, mitochondrial n=1 Tax=Soboliphyme baturini TaxID=241478 RepID=A0A183ILD9_9BILA|nr:unnamed protein product [Soboliphyme baturini]